MKAPRHRPFPAIPPDREDGSSSFVHAALIFVGHLGRVSPAVLLPAWLALVVAAGWPWRPLWRAASGLSAAFLVADWAMVGLLAVLKRSWGPVTPPLLGLTLVRVVVSWTGALIAPTGVGLLSVAIVQASISALAIYATWIEPFRVGVTHQRYRLPAWHNDTPLTILHISDIHFEGWSPREKALLAHASVLKPDLILLTGDYLNLSSVYDTEAQEGVRELLSQLHAPLGIYAVTGSPVVDVAHIVPRIFEGLDVHWLDDAAVSVEYAGHILHLVGVRTTYHGARDESALRALMHTAPAEAITLLLYHTPDLMPIAAQLGIDMYLCGHTHGGQIRLPVYGALATSSQFGKRYEMGRYQEGACTLYVSRGLGMEGLGAPRARLLAPPEIVHWALGNFR